MKLDLETSITCSDLIILCSEPQIPTFLLLSWGYFLLILWAHFVREIKLLSFVLEIDNFSF